MFVEPFWYECRRPGGESPVVVVSPFGCYLHDHKFHSLDNLQAESEGWLSKLLSADNLLISNFVQLEDIIEGRFVGLFRRAKITDLERDAVGLRKQRDQNAAFSAFGKKRS